MLRLQSPFVQRFDPLHVCLGEDAPLADKTNPNSQGGRDTKIHVFLSCRGAISFYVHIVPSGLISIFLDVECDKISCGFKPTRFFQNFYNTTLLTKRQNFRFISWKNHLCHQKDDKKLHITHYYGYFDF